MKTKEKENIKIIHNKYIQFIYKYMIIALYKIFNIKLYKHIYYDWRHNVSIFTKEALTVKEWVQIKEVLFIIFNHLHFINKYNIYKNKKTKVYIKNLL